MHTAELGVFERQLGGRKRAAYVEWLHEAATSHMELRLRSGRKPASKRASTVSAGRCSH
jgi:hypothetical protein